MCGCERHWNSHAECTCFCPDHLHLRLLSDVMLALPCDYCGAAAFEGCTSKSGRPAPMHSPRFYAARDVRSA